MLKSIMNSLSSAWSSKESKAIMLTYEEARARITEVEFNRLAEAFQRAPTTNGYMSKFVFSTDIGEMFPTKIVDCIYVAFGGTSRGILFKDLIAGLVLLTKGTTEEKIRFIFCMYSQDNTVITRDDLTRFTEEIEGIEVPDPVLNRLFQFNTHIEFDEFFVWLSDNPVATSISAWLLGKEAQASSSSCIGAYETSVFKLTDDHDAPTFYQTLAGVTHLEEEDIIDLEKRYWSLHSTSRTGKMDLATLFPLVSPPLPESIVQGFMDAFDENRDGHIDFKEMACGISAAGRGPALERQKFCFKIFDQDKDGVLSVTEVAHMVSVMKLVARENMPETPTEEVTFSLVKDDSEIVQEIWQRVRGEAMTVVEYLEWSLTTPLPDQFLALIYQSTYCKLMAKYAESRGRKMRIVNLDPSPGVLVYDQPIADIRDQINLDECNKSDDTSSGFEYILNYILEHPEWLFGAIGEVREGDYFIFDCPGETEFHAHLNVLKVFAAMLVVKNFRTCVVFIRDSRLATNGYSYIGSCLTPLVSYVSLSLPHVNVMMKIDMLSDEDKSRLHLFINSDIRDVLRYENNKRGSADRELAQSAGIASIILDGHNLVRKKYFPIDIREEQHFKTFLSILDDVMGIITED